MTTYTLPKKWQSLSLGELTERTRPICYGVLKPGAADENGIPLIRVTDISGNYFDDSDLVRISPALDEEFRRSRLSGGEILISIQGTIGRVAICPPEFAGANISRTIAVIHPDERVDRKFVYWFLRFLGNNESFQTVGSTRSSLNIETLRRTRVPVPSLAEQCRIAAILDTAEGLRAKRQDTLVQLDRLIQSIFIDVMRSSDYAIRRIPIEESMDAIIDYRGKTPEKTQVGVPLVTARVVKRGELLQPDEFIAEADYKSWMRRGLPKDGDVLFTTEAPLGEVAQLDNRKVALAQRLLLLRGKSGFLDNTFLMFALTSSEVRKQIETRATGSTVKGIRQSELRKVEIPIPPLEIQREFANQVKRINNVRTDCRKSLAELNHLFTSLQHRAFRGEL